MPANPTTPGLVMIAVDSEADLATLDAAAQQPGVATTTRWQVTGRYTAGPGGAQVLGPAPRDYVIDYELEDVAVARGDAFLDATRVDRDPVMSVTLRQLRDHASPQSGTTRSGAMMVVSISVPAEYEELLNEWYDREHIEELMSCPGFLRTRRYKAVDGIPNYFALYELDSAEALHGERFLYLSGRQFSEFPPIQQHVGPHMTQNICDVYERID